MVQQAWHSPNTQWWSGSKSKAATIDDGTTVSALAGLLQRSPDGKRPASAVGFLYNEAGGPIHRNAITLRGGVSGFVKAHSDVFKLLPAAPGENCPSIRLLSAEERAAGLKAVADAQARRAAELPLCRFHVTGQCLKGSECRFSHDLTRLPAAQSPTSSEKDDAADGSSGGETGRMAMLREQVCYYLSDENLRFDTFFQGIIAVTDGGWIELSKIVGCRKMQQMAVTVAELLAALDGVDDSGTSLVELRREPEGTEAVRRTAPPPSLEGRAPSLAEHPVDVPELSITDSPLELLRTRNTGWLPIVDDGPRRSFAFLRRNSWPLEIMQEEFKLLRSRPSWTVLRSRKEGQVTRSTAWYVTKGCWCQYSYGDVTIDPQERPDWLKAIEARVLGEGCGLDETEWPNSVNLNLYDDDSQNVGWHSDDEGLFRGCERDCRIISASWGAPRTFDIALKDRNHESGRPSIFKDTLRATVLAPGDLCSMEGYFQRHYSHQLAKGASSLLPQAPANVRINLTWRYIVQHMPYCPMSMQ